MNTELTYEQALARLEAIVTALEQGRINLDTISQQMQEAQQLLTFCRSRLDGVETQINSILANNPK